MQKFGFFLFIVFFMFGCGTTKKSVVSHLKQSDSFVYKEVVRVDTIKIKEATIETEFDFSRFSDSISNLNQFIESLNYQLLRQKVKTGTRAGIQFRVDTLTKKIYVTGTCDSSELLSLRKSINEYRSTDSQLKQLEKEVKTKGYSFWNMLLCGIVSFIIGGIATIIFKTLRFM